MKYEGSPCVTHRSPDRGGACQPLRSTAKRRERQSQSVLCLPQFNGKAARTSVTECPLSASGQRQSGENVSHRVSLLCLRSTAKRRERQSQSVLCLPQVNGKTARTSVTECPLSASGQRQNGKNVSHRVSFVCLRSTARTSVTECPLSASGQRQNDENVSHRVSFVCLRSTAKRRERQSHSVLCLPQVNGKTARTSVTECPLSASASVCADTGFLLLTDGRNHCVCADLFFSRHPGTVPDLLRSAKHAPHCLAIFRPEVIVDEDVD